MGVGRTQFQKIGEWEENISTSSFIWEVAKIAKLGKQTSKGFFKNRVRTGRENCIFRKT